MNLVTKEWSQGPDLINEKAWMTCSLVTLEDGTKEIVVAGGKSDRCFSHEEVDIINPDSNTRRSGENEICKWPN